MLVAEGVFGRLSVHLHLGGLVLRLAEVDDDLGGCIEPETDPPLARDRCVFVSGDGEAQVVTQVFDLLLAQLSEFA